MKAVEDVQGSLVDSAGGGQVLEQIVAEQEHESADIERRGRLEVAVGGPDSAAGESVDMVMKIEAPGFQFLSHRMNLQPQCHDPDTLSGEFSPLAR